MLIQPLAWELPYATGAALKKTKKKFELFLPLSVSGGRNLTAAYNYITVAMQGSSFLVYCPNVEKQRDDYRIPTI